MEKRKNIILISGIDTYGVHQEKNRWKKVFRDKYGTENMEEVRIEEVKDWSRIEQDIQSMGLFAEKRLWCFSGGYAKVKKEEWETTSTRKKKWDGIEEKIIALCESAGEDHFFIFTQLLFDEKKWTLIPWLEKNGDVRKYDTVWSADTWGKRFWDLDEKIIQKVLTAYKEAENTKEETSNSISDAIGSSLEKLTLLDKASLTQEDIEESLDRSYSGKLFDLSDSILARNIEKSRTLLYRILESMTPYELLPVLIWLLRWALYAKYLQKKWKTEKEIWSIIPVHPYVLSKTLRAPIRYEEISKIYDELVATNIAYKSGRAMRDGELWRIFGIERALFWLKNR